VSGNFGQILSMNYPVEIACQVRSARRETASVVRPLRTSLILLANRMDLAEVQEGDLIAVLESGAFGMTANPQEFVGHPQPAEIPI
jgi:diaminopimelate decarboxylase